MSVSSTACRSLKWQIQLKMPTPNSCNYGTRIISTPKPDFNQILRDSVPRWNQANFVFLESCPWWAPSVQTELVRSAGTSIPAVCGQPRLETDAAVDYRCHSFTTTLEIYEQIRTESVTGVVLIAGQQLRDCLLFLGRLSRLCAPYPPVLLTVPENSASLMPLLLEAGASAVMDQTVTDIQIADWCRRAAFLVGK
ncbi:MAG: hypothetical protein MK110_04980 [Fuerstiella sp.]|nr:hypothetical protein [Fuerstiella sp.]